jgi:hypothetical protein
VIDSADAFLRLEIKKRGTVRAFNRTIVGRIFATNGKGIFESGSSRHSHVVCSGNDVYSFGERCWTEMIGQIGWSLRASILSFCTAHTASTGFSKEFCTATSK